MERSEITKAVKTWLGTGSINLFGAPYAGKDTHGHILANELDAALLGGGEILRNSKMPKEIKALNATGKLFPTDIYFRVVLPYLKQEKFAGKPLILSSVGRRQGEEAGVIEATLAAGHPIKAAIHLEVDDSVIWERWRHSDSRKHRGAREDDSRDTLGVRLKEFKDKTLPVIDFYRSQNLLIEVNSNQSKDAVSNQILSSLAKFAN